jgi:hypothetical protein
MARLPPFFIPDVPLHLIQRGNNRQVIFADDEDFGHFCACLLDAAHREGRAIHAYVFMTNHLHLLATPATERRPGAACKPSAGEAADAPIHRGLLLDGSERTNGLELNWEYPLSRHG